MLTLADIDAMFPATHDGSVFSDLYKECYGSRPRGITFESAEAFTREFDRLANDILPAVMDEDAERKAVALQRLEARIADIHAVMPTSTKADIIRYIGDAENVGGDLEYLDYKLGVQYGTCKRLTEEGN